ncbi:MAG: hypothetical protein ACRDZY_06590 [Acidimicrobiales bacterium]
MGAGTSIVLIAIGAILRFAVKVHNSSFNIQTIGLILLIVGIVGLILSLFFWRSWGGFGEYGGRSRRVVRGRDGTVVEERDRF